jgi:hypothetical protein
VRSVALAARALLPLVALGVAGAACGGRGARTGRLRALAARFPRDTARFETEASAARCGGSGPGGVLVQGTEGGNGVLVVLRPGDSLVGELPLLARADSTTRRGAIVAARFMIGEGGHGVALDSGTVSVARAGQAGDALTVHVAGSGTDMAGGGRVRVEASFAAVPVSPDTVPCQLRP